MVLSSCIVLLIVLPLVVLLIFSVYGVNNLFVAESKLIVPTNNLFLWYTVESSKFHFVWDRII